MSGETGFMYQVGQTLTAEDVAEMERATLARGEDILRLQGEIDARGDLIREHVRVSLNAPNLEIDGERLGEMLKSVEAMAEERHTEHERVKDVCRRFNREKNDYYSQSCENLKRAETAEAELVKIGDWLDKHVEP